jgi:16S rRNA (cytidine1402-2'-O)-methyltransferase
MPDEACATSPDDRQDGQSALPDGLVLVSTPIGNLGDLTPRGRETLLAADLILCEDTRHTARLLAAIGAKVAQPLHEHNEDAAIPAVLAQLRRGRRTRTGVGCRCAAGVGSGLSSGARSAGGGVGGRCGAGRECRNHGAGAVGTAAVAVPGAGFPPPRQAARRAAFGRIRGAERAGLAATLIWCEAPHRLAETLADMAEAFGARAAAWWLANSQAVRGGGVGRCPNSPRTMEAAARGEVDRGGPPTG